MTIGTVFVGDVGTRIKLEIRDNNGTRVSLVGAPSMQIILAPPGGGPGVAKTAAHVTDGADGLLAYTTAAGDISVPGAWRAQARIVLSSGEVFYSTVVEFNARATL